jgi:hypothetical protein
MAGAVRLNASRRVRRAGDASLLEQLATRKVCWATMSNILDFGCGVESFTEDP